MHHSLRLTVSVLALGLLALPVLADTGMNSYDGIPQPVQVQAQPIQVQQPRMMVLPSYQAQQTVSQNYLPATRVGYVVQPQQATAPVAPQQYGQQQYAQPQPYPAQDMYASQPIAQPGAQAQASVPLPSYNSPSYNSPSYNSGSYTQQASIATAPVYDNSATYTQQTTTQTTTQTPVMPSYAAQQQVTAPQYQTQYQYALAPQQYAQQQYGQQPQLETYAYTQPVAQPAPQQPALTVEYPSAAATSQPSSDASLASEPSSRNFYYALRTGLTIPQDTSFRTSTATIENDYLVGWQLAGAVGYHFRPFNNWLSSRGEVELAYDQQTVNAHTVNGSKFSDPNAYGLLRNLNAMANGYLDFRIDNRFSPYLGGGIGMGYGDFDRVGTSAAGVLLDNNDVGFVWQVMTGLGIKMTNTSTFDVGYRYLQNTGLTLTARDGTSSTTDEGKHVFMLGLRNSF